MENNVNTNSVTPPPYVYSPQVIEEETFTSKEAVFAFLSVGLGYAFIKLFAAPIVTSSAPGLGTAVFLLLLTLFFALYPAQRKLSAFKKVSIIALSVLFSVNVFISSNLLIQLLDSIFVFLVLGYGKLSESEERFVRIRQFFPLDIMNGMVVMPFSEFSAAPKAVKQSIDSSNAGRSVKNVILGFAIAIPSTVTVAFLLMMADDGFGCMIDSILNDGVSKVILFVIQLIIGIPAGAYFFGMCRASQKSNSEELINDDIRERNLSSMRFLPVLAGVCSALPVCVLYVMFFFSQLNYFISSFFSKLPMSMESYSAYARRGFFELCIVSVINLAIIFAVNMMCKNDENGERSAPIKIISSVLCVFTLLLIATAVSKMVMYINVYGLTLLRVYTTWFMLLLAVVFVGIFLSCISPKVNVSKIGVTAFVLMFMTLSFCNIDGVIAEYNVNRYLDGTLPSFDISITDELSTGAIPALSKLDGSLEGQNAEFHSRLTEKAQEAHEKGMNDLRSLTLSDIIAYDLMSK